MACTWRTSTSRAANLTASSFVEARLDRSVLDGANLYGADLEGLAAPGASFRATNLGAVTGASAVFAGVDFTASWADRPANLSRSNLAQAVLTDVDWPEMNLSLVTGPFLAHGANLTGAKLAGVDLTGVDFSGATLLGVGFEDVSGVAEATWTDAVFGGAMSFARSDLPPIAFGGVDWTGVRFLSMDFTGVDLSGADLTGASLRSVTFADITIDDDTSLHTAALAWSVFDDAEVSGLDLSGADLYSTSWVNASMRGVNLRNVWTSDGLIGSLVDFTGADLAGSDWTGANVEDSVYFRGSNLRCAQMDTATQLGTSTVIWSDSSYGPTTCPDGTQVTNGDGCDDHLDLTGVDCTGVP